MDPSVDEMIRYLGRRVATMLPTLFGITLVTFVLMHLPPGDPVSADMIESGRAASAELIEEYRRTHFLDLPLFFNSSPEDLPRQARRLLAELGNDRKRDWAARKLALRGGAALPVLLPLLGGVPERVVPAVLSVLERIAPEVGASEELAQSTDSLGFWRAYWELHRIDFRSANAERLVRRYARRGSPAVLAELATLDTYSLSAAMDEIERDPNDRALERLTGLLASVTSRDVVFRFGESRSRRSETIADWKEWWFKHERDYVAYGGMARLAATLTETRYFKWASRIASFSFGTSSRDGRPIADKLLEKAPVTLLLASSAVVLAYLLAIPLGIFSALNRDRFADRVITVVLFLAASLPAFWVGMNLIRTVGRAGWLPIRGLTGPGFDELGTSGQIADVLTHLVMPLICLTHASVATLSRYQRVAMLDVIGQDYIRTARAKGAGPSRVIIKHALRNALMPVVTLLSLQLPALLGGSVIIEQLFSINGMGHETFEAILHRDYNWIMAVVTLSAILTMGGVLLADLLYALIDPRIGLGVRRGAGRGR